VAALDPAIKRIQYLTGQGPYQGSPSTITGDERQIRSYAMTIATRQEDGTWTVVPYEAGPSVTTKRHIRAAEIALLKEGA